MKFYAIITVDKFGIPRKVEICHERVAHFVKDAAKKVMPPGGDVYQRYITEHWSALVIHPATSSERDCRGG